MGCGTRSNDLQVEHTESGKREEGYLLLCLLFMILKYDGLHFIFKRFHHLWLVNPLGQGSCREILCPKEVCSDQQNTLLCQHHPFATTAVTPPCTVLGPVDLGDSSWHNKKDNMNLEWPSFYTNFFRQKQKWRIYFPIAAVRLELHSGQNGV